jgi:hypothetical protein
MATGKFLSADMLSTDIGRVPAQSWRQGGAGGLTGESELKRGTVTSCERTASPREPNQELLRRCETITHRARLRADLVFRDAEPLLI